MLTQFIVMPLFQSVQRALPAPSSGFNPINLFLAGEQGAWYDPSDLTTLFQDSAGTTPVTASGQPVGLMLDKSRGLVRGSELLTNGGFDSGTTGWATTAYNTILTATAGGMQAECAVGQTNIRSSQAISTVIGRTYKISAMLNVVSGSLTQARLKAAPAVNLDAAIANSADNLTTTAQTLSVVFVAQTTTTFIGPAGVGVAGDKLFVDNISVRELPGNHATQVTAASRPVLARHPATGIRNLLTFTDLTGGTGGTVGAGAVAPTGWTFPSTGGTVAFGTTSYGSGGVTFTTTVNTQRPFIAQTINVLANTTYLVSVRVAATSGAFTIADTVLWATVPAGSSAVTYLRNGVAVPGSTVFAANDLISALFTVGVTAGTAQARSGPGSFAGAGLTGTCTFTMPQAEVGSTPTAYQKVVAATEVTEVNVPDTWSLLFDGVDDFMLTGSINFTTTDKMSVFAGVSKLSDVAIGAVFELSADINVNNGVFGLLAPMTAAANNVSFRSKGTTLRVSTTGSLIAPVSLVLSGEGDISGDIARSRVNGGAYVTDTLDQGSGNYGNYPLYIGRRGGTTLPFNGRIYGLIIRGALSSDNTIISTERYLASKTGIALS